VPVRPAELDAGPWRLNVQNGTLDLRSGALHPHDRADLITRLAAVDYDPDAPAPAWHAFLERILGGDPELIAFVQRALGYALTGDTREQVLFILHGSGANGKSTLLEAVGGVMGDYALVTMVDTLMVRYGSTVPNDVARLRGARLVVAVEPEEGQRLAEGRVKQLTGGDRIAARFLRQEFFEFRPEFKLFLATNHKPDVRGTDDAIWRRVRMVPFAVRIPEAEQDKTLRDKLAAEAAGILAWLVRGCLDWQRDGLGLAPAVRAATAGYRAEMDRLAGFLEECCILRPDAQVTVKALYEAHVAWCTANGEPPLAKRTLCLRLRERGLEVRRGTGGVHSLHRSCRCSRRGGCQARGCACSRTASGASRRGSTPGAAPCGATSRRTACPSAGSSGPRSSCR
jgi:putative DNA primase/helicase